MDYLTKIALITILILAGFIRIYNLSANPPELFNDELINYTSAKSIFETGHDLDGNLYPYFSDRVEFRPPLYGYSTYLSSVIFGETVFAIRLPAVIYGLISIFLVYLLTIEITKNKTASLFASFTMAIIPWHIHYSRIGWEPASMLVFFLLGLFFFVKATKKHHPIYIYLSALSFGIMSYTYFGAIIISLFFFITGILLNKKYFSSHLKIILSASIIYFITILPIVTLSLTQPNFFERSSRISTFRNGINLDSLFVFSRNYIAHFSPYFLFKSGDPNLRHGAQTGVLYLWLLPFIIFGLVSIFRRTKDSTIRGFLFLWILIFPLGASITNDGVPHAHRTLIGIPLFSILSGAGFNWFLEKISQFIKFKALTIFFICLILLISFYSLSGFLKKYYFEYPALSQSDWRYGQTEVFKTVRSLENNYQRVCLGNLNYYDAKPLIAFHLSSSPLKPIEGIKDSQCFLPKTISVQENITTLEDFKLYSIVYDLNNQPIYYIYTLD